MWQVFFVKNSEWLQVSIWFRDSNKTVFHSHKAKHGNSLKKCIAVADSMNFSYRSANLLVYSSLMWTLSACQVVFSLSIQRIFQANIIVEATTYTYYTLTYNMAAEHPSHTYYTLLSPVCLWLRSACEFVCGWLCHAAH